MQTEDSGSIDVVLLPLTTGSCRLGLRIPLQRIGGHTDEMLGSQ